MELNAVVCALRLAWHARAAYLRSADSCLLRTSNAPLKTAEACFLAGIAGVPLSHLYDGLVRF
jgi:hypothetical protein